MAKYNQNRRVRGRHSSSQGTGTREWHKNVGDPNLKTYSAPKEK